MARLLLTTWASLHLPAWVREATLSTTNLHTYIPDNTAPSLRPLLPPNTTILPSNVCPLLDRVRRRIPGRDRIYPAWVSYQAQTQNKVRGSVPHRYVFVNWVFDFADLGLEIFAWTAVPVRLRSQPSEPVAPRFLERGSASDAIILPSRHTRKSP